MNASEPFEKRRPITDALAKLAYEQQRIRIETFEIGGFDCLVTSRQGLFAVSADGRVATIIWGSFFGICENGHYIYIFEACDRPYSATDMGRIVRLSLQDGLLLDPIVLVQGIDNNCHQIAYFDDILHVVDTSNQRILRFTSLGEEMESRTILQPVQRNSSGDEYRHINSIEKIDGRIAVMLHNGGNGRDRASELLWLDEDWNEIKRDTLPGKCCHDIAKDATGRIWHCGSMAGELINNLGQKYRVSDMLTRGLTCHGDGFIVGYSQFGKRVGRERLTGGVLFLGSDMVVRADVRLDAAATDLMSLR